LVNVFFATSSPLDHAKQVYQKIASLFYRRSRQRRGKKSLRKRCCENEKLKRDFRKPITGFAKNQNPKIKIQRSRINQNVEDFVFGKSIKNKSARRMLSSRFIAVVSPEKRTPIAVLIYRQLLCLPAQSIAAYVCWHLAVNRLARRRKCSSLNASIELLNTDRLPEPENGANCQPDDFLAECAAT